MSVFDKDKARVSFNRAAHRYDQSAKLQQQVAHHLVGLVAQKITSASTILDIGCGTGQVTEEMCRLFPGSEVVALDFAKRMLEQTGYRLQQHDLHADLVCADAESLPFAADSFDLIVSSLMLQWSNDLENTLRTCRETLKEDGSMFFSTFTEGTLSEVKQSWEEVDQSDHTSQFLSKQALEEVIESAGFNCKQIHYNTITMTYSSVREMIVEMKQIGASNAHKNRARGLTGKQRFNSFEKAFEKYCLPNKQYPCTWKLAYAVCGK